MVDIRSAAYTDIDQLVSLNAMEYWDDLTLWKNMDQEMRWQEGLWWVDPDLLRWHLDILHRSQGGMIVAEKEGIIIGEIDFVRSYDNIANFSGERIHIIWIVVDHQYRKQGIATAMISYLQSLTSLPIWVEPEDHRSISLYEKLGDRIFTISNWKMDLDDIGEFIIDHRLHFEQINFEQIQDKLSQLSLLIGRYYAPEYDLIQLSHSDPVADLMWGNTGGAEFHRYQLAETVVYAIITQYPRIWISLNYNREELKQIIASITLYLFELGFDTVFLQIYNESTIDDMLEELGYHCTIASDPVYQLS